MSRNVSATALQAMLARETDQVFLVCMRLSHASFTTVRIVNNTETVVRVDGNYMPFPFHIVLPQETDEQVPQITVQFDNIDSMITNLVRELQGRPLASFDVVLASSPDTVEAGPFNFSILNVSYDANNISCVLGFEEDILNQAIPKGNYNPSNSPGLFV
jgi:Domain of unknown function (DUF1833)